ncbi:MAG TPA: zinc-dependent alcohol dehydrogenase [Elusimicrobiota bacterium]|nr:zinc-dependent alcohol dehydrogenase [Elusimicrobiota bacterium]
MKALVFHSPKDVRFETVPDPRIENARDVILRVTSTSICGSDLHIYNGYFAQRSAMILGHEFMGVVAEVGPRVRNLRKGDRVVVPFPIACGDCFFCSRGLPGQCERTNPAHYGPDGAKDRGGGLFGYTDEYGPYEGGQAQYVRVPYADVGPRKVPDGLPDERVLFLSDIIPTGWTAAEWCELKGGETVAVFGCGPVGLMAMKSARLQGAGRVLAIDPVAYRRDAARRVADAEPIDPEAGDPVEAVRELTAGRGADACIDAVGLEAGHGFMESVSNVLHLQVGTINALRAAIKAARRGGTVSVIGVYGAPAPDFPLGEIFEKGLRLRSGQAPVQACIDKLLDMTVAGRITAEDLVTHRVPLSEGPAAYRVFNDKGESALKFVLKPWSEAVRQQPESQVEIDELDSEPASPVLDTGYLPPSSIL